MTIARHLHQIWLGPAPAPRAQMDEWSRLHSGWSFTVWDEAALRDFGLTLRAHFEAYVAMGLWHGAANVARLEVLHRLGGVYADADSVPTRSWDDAPFMDADHFCGRVQPRPSHPGLIGNAFIGSVPRHPILEDAIRRVAVAKRRTPPWRHTGVVPYSDAVRGRAHLPGVVIMPTAAFYPLDRHGTSAPDEGAETWARHLWGSTRGSGWDYGDPTPEVDHG